MFVPNEMRCASQGKRSERRLARASILRSNAMHIPPSSLDMDDFERVLKVASDPPLELVGEAPWHLLSKNPFPIQTRCLLSCLMLATAAVSR